MNNAGELQPYNVYEDDLAFELINGLTRPQRRNHERDCRAARGRLLWQIYYEPWDTWPFDETAGLGGPFGNESCG